MNTTTQEIIGKHIGQQVERKARHGHRVWVMYRDRDGLWHGRVATAANLKAAMLATGTQMKAHHSCYLVYPDGTNVIGFWWMVNNMRRQRLLGLVA